MRWYKQGIGVTLVLGLALFVFASASPALAVTSKSDNFEASEAEFGAGAALETCSGQYCARASIGNMTPGDETRSASTAAFSSITDETDPLLEVIVDPGKSDLGVLSIDKTASKTTIVRVRTHLSSGYTMQMIGTAPVYSGHSLATPQTPTASAPGTEQFGINLAANTTPGVGADPEHQPDSGISFGQVAPAYSTPDVFTYTDGEVVAFSDKDSGRTDYTISMIINVSGATPAGHYSSDFSVLVVPAF